MQADLKALDEQVIVITGASSGIGLVTARMAARMGRRSWRSRGTRRPCAASSRRSGARADRRCTSSATWAGRTRSTARRRPR